MKTPMITSVLVAGLASSMAFKFLDLHSDGPQLLSEAIKNQTVQCEFVNNPGFSHYDKCLLVKLRNPGRSAIRVMVPAGMMVNPSDPVYQNLVVTENRIVMLNPGEQKYQPVFAMCTEPNDHTPGSEKVGYQLASDVPGKLQEIAAFIAKENYHNSEAQNAVWSVSANRSLENISGFDTAAVRKLQGQVARLTGQKIPEPPKPTDYKRNYYAPPTVMKVKVSGSYSFSFQIPRQVLIGMYNTQNVLVRELYKNEQEPPGRKTIPYAFDASVYTDSLYYMRMFVNGEKRMETKMNMH